MIGGSSPAVLRSLRPAGVVLLSVDAGVVLPSPSGSVAFPARHAMRASGAVAQTEGCDPRPTWRLPVARGMTGSSTGGLHLRWTNEHAHKGGCTASA